jgi:hypothetical protein
VQRHVLLRLDDADHPDTLVPPAGIGDDCKSGLR